MNWFSKFLGSSVSADLSPEQLERLNAWKALPASNLDAPHLSARYIVVDIEASGLDLKNDRLISIGAVAVTHGLIDNSDAFEVVLRQEKVSDQQNILIHGIGASAQREGMEPAEALLQFLEYAGTSPLIAYHAFFDQSMIDQANKTHLGFHPELVWHDLAWVLPELYSDRISGIVGLDTWLESFHIQNYQRHNAVSDCLATAQLFQVAMRAATGAGLDNARQLLLVEQARRSLRRS